MPPFSRNPQNNTLCDLVVATHSPSVLHECPEAAKSAGYLPKDISRIQRMVGVGIPQCDGPQNWRGARPPPKHVASMLFHPLFPIHDRERLSNGRVGWIMRSDHDEYYDHPPVRRDVWCKCGGPDLPGSCPGWRSCPMHGEDVPKEEGDDL